MSCREYADAIVDLARGADLAADRSRELRAHLECCGACRTRLGREEALTAGLGALSKTVAGVRPSAGLESRLLEAFQAQHAPAPRVAVRRWPLWAGAAAAAAVVLAVGFAWFVGKSHPPRVEVADRQPADLPASAAVESAHAVPVAIEPVIERPRPRRAVQPAAGILRPVGFVALPGAAGLPEFERGVIQRVELQLASLPNYGIQIAPDAARDPIQADLLVGQDGLARAIRLVGIERTTTRSRP